MPPWRAGANWDSAKRTAVDFGRRIPFHIRRLERSRISGAPFRFAPRCTASGTSERYVSAFAAPASVPSTVGITKRATVGITSRLQIGDSSMPPTITQASGC